MHNGAITDFIDVAQLAIYAFWIFFAGLIYYLRSEDKREGYPLESDRSPHVRVEGFPPIPKPKSFKLSHGGTKLAPDFRPEPDVTAAQPIGPWLGAPLEPTGNPMVDGVGPASYGQRADSPDLTLEGELKIVPLRVAGDHFWLESRDPDPRGMQVVGADQRVAGVVHDVWIDRSEVVVRYFEVQLQLPVGETRVLLPTNYVTSLDGYQRKITVKSILGGQFADVPALRNAESVTFLEEDKITAYFGGGNLYAEPTRGEPIL